MPWHCRFLAQPCEGRGRVPSLHYVQLVQGKEGSKSCLPPQVFSLFLPSHFIPVLLYLSNRSLHWLLRPHSLFSYLDDQHYPHLCLLLWPPPSSNNFPVHFIPGPLCLPPHFLLGPRSSEALYPGEHLNTSPLPHLHCPPPFNHHQVSSSCHAWSLPP